MRAVNLFFIRVAVLARVGRIHQYAPYYDCSMKDKFKDLFQDWAKSTLPFKANIWFSILDIVGGYHGWKTSLTVIAKWSWIVLWMSTVNTIRRDFVKKVFRAEDANDKLILINDESKKLNLRTYLTSLTNMTTSPISTSRVKRSVSCHYPCWWFLSWYLQEILFVLNVSLWRV